MHYEFPSMADRSERSLEAGGGLRLEARGPDHWRIAWSESDWLGPVGLGLPGGGAPLAPGHAERRPGSDSLGRFESLELAWPALPPALRASVRAYAERPLLVFRLEARDAIEGLATGRFAEPPFAWPWLRPARREPGGAPEGLRGYAHQYTEFAFPTFSDATLASFLLFPHRPRVVAPLWLNAPDGRSLMLAPLGDFHDQIISVPRTPERAADGVRCGWHGDLAGVPRGFATELAVWGGAGPRAVLEEWAGWLRERFGTERPSRYADATLGRLSYWTDNGAAYWYRTEPGLDVPSTLEEVARGLAEKRIPVAAWELDSWFYPHAISRSVDPEGQEHVPPTGLLRWEPRDDVLPEGIPALRERLGNPPLVLHARHFSSRSPYFESIPAWIDGDRAHPEGPELFERLYAWAKDWGAISVEQDWLVEMYLGVRGLRERPGRARQWQEGVDRAAERNGLGLVWCMATPADFLQTLSLRRVGAIRTSGDYRYLGDNPGNWVRFLYTNALARALGLHPFKDVFLSDSDGEGLDGDPHAEAEAMLSALSSGPVGIGDRVGRSVRSICLRTCREDGVLVKPDLPIAAIERCLRRDCHFEPEPLVAETWSEHPAGRWTYLVAMHAWREKRPLDVELPLRDLGRAAPTERVAAYDWRRQVWETLEPEAVLRFALEPGDWTLRILCPLLHGRLAVLGDAARYASAGDRRLRGVRASSDGSVALEVLGAPGERFTLSGWAGAPVAARVSAEDGRSRKTRLMPDAGGGWRLPLEVDSGGALVLRLEPDAL